MALTDEQSQELMDAIIEKCETMELSPGNHRWFRAGAHECHNGF